MKTLIEQVLEDIGIQTRDENKVLRSPEDLTNDVMALLNQCGEEDAARLLFMILTAKHIEDAAGRIEERRL